jgi:hypothetical protein
MLPSSSELVSSRPPPSPTSLITAPHRLAWLALLVSVALPPPPASLAGPTLAPRDVTRHAALPSPPASLVGPAPPPRNVVPQRRRARASTRAALHWVVSLPRHRLLPRSSSGLRAVCASGPARFGSMAFEFFSFS